MYSDAALSRTAPAKRSRPAGPSRSNSYVGECAHEALETLERPDFVVPRGHRTGNHHRERRQRRQRHPRLFPGRGAIRILLLWTMIPVTLSLIMVQEMSARMGAVTGKGLSDLIREEFGLRITFLMMLRNMITNFGNVVTEFIGVATSLEFFGLSRYVAVPVCGLIVWLIVVKDQYKSMEKVLLAASFFYITYIFAGTLAHPAGMPRRRQPSSRRRGLRFANRPTCSW